MTNKTPDADRVIAGWQETIREVEANKDGFVEISRKQIATTPTQAMDDKTLVERLYDEAACADYAATANILNEAADTIESQATRIEALEARLEIDPSHPYDGIYARDETIRLLEQRIEALEAALRDAAKAERDRLRKLPDDVLLRAMDSLNNGLINKPDASNPRGFVTYYDPLQASKNLVAALADALESQP